MTKTREKNAAANLKTAFWENMGLNLQNPSFDILCKIAFSNKQKRLNKELIIWSKLSRQKSSLFRGTALKNDKFHL